MIKSLYDTDNMRDMLLQKYQQYNERQQKVLLFRIGSDAGFFSEYNNMIIVMYYCLLHGIAFRLYSEDANFAYARGWQDYFEPFCKEEKGGWNSIFNDRYQKVCVSHRGKRLRFQWLLFQGYLWRHRIDYLTYELFHVARALPVDEVQEIPALGLRGTLVDNCRALSQMVFRYNVVTASEVKCRVETVRLSVPYVSVHIRRGDKVIESAHMDLCKYMDAIAKRTNLRSVFVATDDYSVVEELQTMYPDWTFCTNTPKTNRGYDQRTFESQSAEYRKEELLTLFATIEIMAASELFVGTLSSNIGMYMYWRMPIGKCVGVDYQEWKIW